MSRCICLVVSLAFMFAALPVAPSAASAACPAVPSSALTVSLRGADSPYLGHTSSADGKGSEFAGSWTNKALTLDKERAMGLRFTFLPVHWSLIEPEKPSGAPPAPVAPGTETEAVWESLDRFVRGARQRNLNVLLQVVVGGNAGGPPAWAGRRVQGRSAPKFMDGTEPGSDGQGLVPFVGKLVERYRPAGVLATADGWTDGYGVTNWLLDNEPDSYLTNWDTIADDYAEFVFKATSAIKARDASATIIAPESGEGDKQMPWLRRVLQTGVQQASPDYVANGVDYAAGPSIDVVSFHSYELIGLIFSNQMFDGDDLAVQQLYKANRAIRAAFSDYEMQPGATYAPKTRFWHTEGGFGYLADDPEGKRNWIVQWLTLGFAAGVEKMTVMDATPEEAQSVHTITCLLPMPFPIEPLTATGDVYAFRVTRNTDTGWTYVAWARPGAPNVFTQSVRLPVRTSNVKQVSLGGQVTTLTPSEGSVTAELPSGGRPFNEPVFIVDDAPASKWLKKINKGAR